ncbi:hypothetical protein PF005_g4988 [Phytophthora fragariae]|uniref:Uncharacterized protein n=1 Tax=Phytophthora fragariae TaxID=53985 RepID=A0A6A3UNT5_9STRA|nr:hypothetical protein PF003_g4734 [Phytophthora fragariae]KAE9136883.1 hypothetical protein PF010_g1519 [Phytophthora fragariae]KAE9152306.1 hypothetical protein PF006_g3466 [Phytophthora fragariae]KAE9226781.1 hypothetical protein PF005_g4988 [Phytophthora fragariae]KAE9249193.1 hypothetical protein PF004_g3503 [Phytophthora fragariae]
MESIEENAENLGGAPAASGVSPPDGSGGGGQPTQAAANPPQTTNEDAGDQTGPRPMLTDPNRSDLSTPAGLGAVRSQVQRWAARGSTGDTSRATPATEVDSTSNPLLAPTTTTTTMGLPVTSAPNLVNQPDPSTLVNAPSVQPVPITPPSSPGNGGGAASSGQHGQVQYWNQTGGGYVSQVIPDPNGGWPQVTQTPVQSQVMGPAGLLFGYNNGVPVPTPAHSQYGAVVPPTPTSMMTTMTPPTTRIRTAIPSYQNYTIGTPSVAAGVGGGYPVFQPAGWAQTIDPNRPRSAPDARTTQPVAWTPAVSTTSLSYLNQYAYPSQAAVQMPPAQYVLPTPSVQYAQAPPATTTPAPTQSAPTPTGSQPMMAGAPPPPGGTPPSGGPTPTQGQTPAQGVPIPSGPPPPNPASYGPRQAPPPYSYGNAYGQAPDPRRDGMPSNIRNAIKMIQPFYSDSTTVDKARTFWNAFERATEGVEDALRLSAFRECLMGKAGEQ